MEKSRNFINFNKNKILVLNLYASRACHTVICPEHCRWHLQWGWTDNVFPSVYHYWRTPIYSIRRELQVNTPLSDGPAGTFTCYYCHRFYFSIFLPLFVTFSFSFSFIIRLFFYPFSWILLSILHSWPSSFTCQLSHLLMYFSMFFWLLSTYSLWFNLVVPCVDTEQHVNVPCCLRCCRNYAKLLYLTWGLPNCNLLFSGYLCYLTMQNICLNSLARSH